MPASYTLLLIPNEFGTVFELGVQRLETLEEIEVQYPEALAEAGRETASHKTLLGALTFKATRFAFCLPVFYRFFIAVIRSKFCYNFSAQNDGAHLKVIPRLAVSYSNENKLHRRHYSGNKKTKNKKQKNSEVIRTVMRSLKIANSANRNDDKNKNKNKPSPSAAACD